MKAERGKSAARVERHISALETSISEKTQEISELKLRHRKDLTEEKSRTLHAQGRLNTRGLYEKLIQELAMLAGMDPISNPSFRARIACLVKNKTGSELVERFKRDLQADATWKPQKQEDCLYKVYETLSQNIHAHKSVQQLKVAGGRIIFVQDNLNADQVQAILCLGNVLDLELECIWNQQSQVSADACERVQTDAAS